MEFLISSFESIPPAIRTLILVSGLVLFWAAEGAIPLFRFQYRRYRHAGLNIVFTLTTLVVNFGLAFMIVSAARFSSAQDFGVLYVAELPLWLHVVFGIMVLDLVGAWLIHWIQHRIRWMWKFHLIHHTDTNVDVTTALRHHPGESAFRAVFTALGVLIAGLPIGIVLLYQTLSALFSQFNHANIGLPDRLDRALSWVIVTPNMHKVHHHFVQPLTDTNYGNIFSIWDRLFGTFAWVQDPQTELTYGIDTHMSPEEHDRLWNLLAIPFQSYRPPSGSKFGDRDAPSRHDDSRRAAEATT
ncbi:MAG: sterol desaturase family protein [Rhodothermales bacterium]|nr:sterol desaturase family protein [Rhodothermales bacterium]